LACSTPSGKPEGGKLKALLAAY